jgi:hypothetical protein
MEKDAASGVIMKMWCWSGVVQEECGSKDDGEQGDEGEGEAGEGA